MEVRADGRRDVRSGRGKLTVLHANPALQQPVPMRDEAFVGAAARPHGPPDDAARTHRIAAVEGDEGDQRSRRVGCDAEGALIGGDRLGQSGHGDRVRLIERAQESFGEAACGARGRRGRSSGVEYEGRPRRRWIARRDGDGHAGGGHVGIGLRAQPAEQVGGLCGAAVVHGDAGRDPHRGRALGRIFGTEQFVGQVARRRAVACHRDGIGQPGRERGRACRSRGPVQPRGLAGVAASTRRTVGELVGKCAVAHAVLGQPQREIG